MAESYICHVPVEMRKKYINSVNAYTEFIRRLRVEDVNLWINFMQRGIGVLMFKNYIFE